MAGEKTANQAAVEALQAMSPARRAIQLASGVVTNAANTASFGGVGALGDLVRGTPIGTTGGQISAQVRAASPVADTASQVIGLIGGGAGIARAAPAALAAGRTILTAAPAVGVRAAALGASNPTYAATAAKILAPAAAALGVGAALNGSDSAPAAPKAAPAAKDAVAQALAQGRAAQVSDVDAIHQFIAGRLKDGVTDHELAGLSQIASAVPALIKTPAPLDVKGTAATVATNLFSQRQKLIDDALAAGTINAEQHQAGSLSAQEAYFNQLAGMAGYDPSKAALAAQVVQ